MSSLVRSRASVFRLPSVSWICGAGLFYLSLLSLRILLIRRLQISPSRALELGTVSGAVADLALAVALLAAALLLDRMLPRKLSWSRMAPFVITFFGVFIHSCYLLFFRRTLDLVSARYGTQNLWEIRGSIVYFLSYPFAQLSLALLAGSFWLIGRSGRDLARRGQVVGFALLLLLSAQIIKQVPVWMHWPRQQESPLAYNVIWKWAGEVFRSGGWMAGMWGRSNAPESVDLSDATRVLNEYSGKLYDAPSMSHELSQDVGRGSALRERLGLAHVSKPNIILLFLESARALELIDPRLGPWVYPDLRRVLGEHGLLFSQVYSTAHYTASGQFSTLCSAMDRTAGPLVYPSSSYLKIRCLPEVMVENGYATYWMNPFQRHFSGKFAFESAHGTQHFLDREVFKAKSDEDHVDESEWGVSDRVFLRQALDRLEEIHRSSSEAGGSPFFAHLLTTGTHAPFHKPRDAKLPEELVEKAQGEPNHLSYLYAARGLDQALGEFFERFFQSDLARDTVVVVAADHGTGVLPEYPRLEPHQRALLWNRIILGVVAKGIKGGEVERRPVHQMDIAPMIAGIAGLSGKVSWLGRDASDGRGTPWVFRNGGRIFYRFADTYCHQPLGQSGLMCWKTPPFADPLLDESMEMASENIETTAFARRVLDANEALIDSGSYSLQP